MMAQQVICSIMYLFVMVKYLHGGILHTHSPAEFLVAQNNRRILVHVHVHVAHLINK